MWEDSSHGPCSLTGLQPAAFSRLLRLPRKGCRRSPGCPGSSCLSSYVKHSFVKEKEGGWKSLGCLGEEQQRIKSRHLQRLDLRPPPLTLPRATSPRLVTLPLVQPGTHGGMQWLEWVVLLSGAPDSSLLYIISIKFYVYVNTISLYTCEKIPYPLPQFPSLAL